MPHNELLHPICNIGIDAHLLFTKSPSSKLQECLGKVFFPLGFLQFHSIVILVWDELFGWIHTIWVGNDKTSLWLFRKFISPHTYSIIWLLRLCHIDRALFTRSIGLLPPIHVAFCWNIGTTTCYQDLPLVTCRMNSWRLFSSTRACSPLWLTWKRLPLAVDSWCHVPVTFSLPSFKLFQNVSVDGCNVDWKKWNKGWILLLWYPCRRSCCNILDAGFYTMHVVLQWEYKLFTVILDLHKVIVNH